jgi:zinc protease
MRTFLRALVLLLCVTVTSAFAAPSRPAPAVRTLANGLRVVVLPRTGLPIVQAQLQVPAGLSAESEGQAGLAWITAQSLRQGTSSRSAEDFTTELDTLGATFAVNVTRDAAQVVAGAGRDQLGPLLELMSDAVVNPLFDEAAFQATRRQVATQLGQAARTPATLADERLAALVFGAHPYAHPLRGDLEVLVGTTRDHARTFHRDHWRPDRAVLVIAGDVAPEAAFAQADEWFSRWSGKALPLD